MWAGPSRKRVRFEVENRVSDGGGGNSVTWDEHVTVWGKFKPERGGEKFEGGRNEASLMGILKIRSSTEARLITTAMRVKIDGVAYQIRSIPNPDQRNRFLEMLVERGVST